MPDDPRPVVVKRGDHFFSDQQISRLKELMAAWRAARDVGLEFPTADLAELDALIAAELEATTERSKGLLRQRSTDVAADGVRSDQPGA